MKLEKINDLYAKISLSPSEEKSSEIIENIEFTAQDHNGYNINIPSLTSLVYKFETRSDRNKFIEILRLLK